MLIKRGFGLPQQFQPLSHLPFATHFTSIFNSLHSLHSIEYPSPTNHHFLPYFTTIYPSIVNKVVNRFIAYLLHDKAKHMGLHNRSNLL